MSSGQPAVSPRYRKVDGQNFRALADALEFFRSEGLSDDDEIEIRASSWPMPEARDMGFMWVVGPTATDGSAAVIEMPPAGFCKARTTTGQVVRLCVGTLHLARCDAQGNVTTGVGEHLHNVQLIPSRHPYTLSDRDEAIVLAALHFLGRTEDCYPEINAADCPGLRGIRYDRLPAIRISNLSELHKKINGVLRTPVTASIARKALQAAGMQLPRTARRRRISAVIGPRSAAD